MSGDNWLKTCLRKGAAMVTPPPEAETLAIDRDVLVDTLCGDRAPMVREATRLALEGVQGVDVAPLALHSPALQGYDWENYLRCSEIRVAKLLQHLTAAGINSGRILDLGSYFGNVSLALSLCGYEVTAVDGYSSYGPVFAKTVAVMKERGIEVAEAGEDQPWPWNDQFDAVALMGVIEHIPHTPKPLMERLLQSLRPGGLLVVETPNLGYIYNRLKMSRGETIFCPIALQYDTRLPFEGHHREYLPDEVTWMFRYHRLSDIVWETFNYSIYQMSSLSGDDRLNFMKMEADPLLREIIIASGRKKKEASPMAASVDQSDGAMAE